MLVAAVLAATSNLAAAPKAPVGIDAGARERIAYIQTALDEGKKNARIWWGMWIAGYAGLALGQYALSYAVGEYSRNETRLDQLRKDFHYGSKSTFPKKEQWVNYLVGGVKSTLSLGMLLVMPFTPAYAPGRLAAMPEGTPEEITGKLIEAERLMEVCAGKERMGRAWWKHLLGVAVNGAGAIIIWQYQGGRDPWKDAVISFATGMAAIELTIWTQPTRAMDDWENYKKKYRTGGGAYREEDVSRWFITLCPGGLAAGVYF
jgi:hypothetical protein